MSSKREEDLPEEKPAERRSLKQEDSDDAAATFDDLNNDCLVHILSFMKIDEMNDATLVNSRFCEARNADSLDQTRTATIAIKTVDMRVGDLVDTIANKGWTQFFSEESNYKCLKFVGVQRLWSRSVVNIQYRLEQNPVGLRFESVTGLDLSLRAGNNIQSVSRTAISAIVQMCPNLQHVDLSYVKTTILVISDITKYNPNLTCIKCNGARGVCFGHITPQHVGNLLEIQLDDSAIFGSVLSETGSYLFMQCHRLERVSIKNATWKLKYATDVVPVPQEILIKLVRYHPTLRWLRSDLTDENMAILKTERPEVTLINE